MIPATDIAINSSAIIQQSTTTAPLLPPPPANTSSSSVASSLGGPSSTPTSEEEELFPPENFAMVEQGVYRSAFPRSKNIPFLRRLRLKSIIALVPEDVSETMMRFYSSSNIALIKQGSDGNKWPFKEIGEEVFHAALKSVLDPANRPVLIHCNKGKHRTGSLVGALRKVRGWAYSSIFAEYLDFALPKARLEDQRFIENFDDVAFLESMGREGDGETGSG